MACHMTPKILRYPWTGKAMNVEVVNKTANIKCKKSLPVYNRPRHQTEIVSGAHPGPV